MNSKQDTEALHQFTDAVPASALGGNSELPDYVAALDAFHRAMHFELLQMIRELPLHPGDCVLDVPCGDGFYSACLYYAASGKATILAADSSPEYLALGEERVRRVLGDVPISFVRADVYELPFADESFDLVWCAQSLVSLEKPVEALRGIRRVLRPQGTAAVLEIDEFHHLLLPWPVDLDLALQQALRLEGAIRYGTASRLCPGRYLRPMFLAAGFGSYRKKTYAVDRLAPLTEADRLFLLTYFQSLRELVAPHLRADDLIQLDRLIEPHSTVFLLDHPDFEMTCLNIVALGQKIP